MLVACFLAFLPWFSAASAVDSSCSDFGEDSEETCALQTQSSRKKWWFGGDTYELGDFDPSLPSGYFKPTTTRYNGKKVFFSKNSCATVLYCLKAIYGRSDDTRAWGRQGPVKQTLKIRLCKLIPASRWCTRRERRPAQNVMPGDPNAILGPRAHEICKQFNFEEGEQTGCSEWMKPFMNQLALTLGSSSEQYNLFLDFGSSGIKECFPPIKAKYDQDCVNKSLTKSVQEADIFLFFPDWYCGKSCAIEVEIAQKVKQKRNLQLIELNWDAYYDLFSSFATPSNPSGEVIQSDVEQWRAGSKAGLHILNMIQMQKGSGGFIPDGECAIRQGACASGKTYTNDAGLKCLFKSFGGVAGDGACHACKDAVDAMFATATTGELGACAETALAAAGVCAATNVEDAELGWPVCEALVVAACAALEDEVDKDKGITLETAQDYVCRKHLGVCPATDFTRDFCGCLSAGQCIGLIGEDYCCSGESVAVGDHPCLRDFHQGEFTPKICT